MAFMMPVVKNDWDIYKSNRCRRSSECSNPQLCRSRKVSECGGSKSEGGVSLSTSPGSEYNSMMGSSPAHRSVPTNMTSRQMSSRNSASSLAQSSSSPGGKSMSQSISSPPNNSQASLNKFHTRLVDKLKRSLRHSNSSSSNSKSNNNMSSNNNLSGGNNTPSTS